MHGIEVRVEAATDHDALRDHGPSLSLVAVADSTVVGLRDA
jgi:hypothetical protein